MSKIKFSPAGIFVSFFLCAVLAATVISCSRVPITNRKQVVAVSESEMIAMSVKQYAQFLAKHPPLPNSDSRVVMVKSVGGKIQMAVEQFMKEKKLSKRIAGYKWEFNVVDDKTVNAWCMPGGKVVVYTGLLPVTQTEAGLAVVMGHEIAHAVARHGNERMSQAMIAEFGKAALATAVAYQSQAAQEIFMQSYGLGSTLGLLKYSRTHESEADKLGLVFMALAGYNPEEAVAFWQRMAKDGSNTLQILSTHPNDQTRIEDLKKFLPQAKK
ncbi:MAG: M48 family metallopeptidase, partial [Bacteroidota bacterium]